MSTRTTTGTRAGSSSSGGPSGPGARRRSPVPDGTTQHRDWLTLIDVTGPFLSLPVLRRIWPTLDPLEKKTREQLRREHATWLDAPAAGQRAWVRYVLADLLGWGDALLWPASDTASDAASPLAALTADVDQHDTRVTPSFVLVDPSAAAADAAADNSDVAAGVKPDAVCLLGLVVAPGQSPTGRIAGQAWAATPVDRAALTCRHHGIELALVTNGRQWALVWAPRGGVTTTAVFDAVSWPEAAERDVVRAFVSLLCRRRFFAVPDAETLVPLLKASLGSQEEITEALGVQVRQAVELLVAAFGRWHVAEHARGGVGLRDIPEHDIYRGAVAVMMRIVFLLYAEERGLLPADNDLYARTYSVGRLCAELEQQLSDGATEDDLEQSTAAWHRLRALFTAVFTGIDHPRLRMHAHGGSLFDPATHPWLPLAVDDRTVLHTLRAVQYVQVGSGRSRERRTLSFRSLDVEQIGYVYEGLLSYDARRAPAGEVVVGLVGKEGLEAEVLLSDLEDLASRHRGRPLLAAVFAERFKDSGIGSAKAIEKRLAPLEAGEREETRKALLAVTRGDYPTAERLLPFANLLRRDLRDQPVVILESGLYVTESPLRKNTGTHYTPRFLAEEVANNALEPLVYLPGPLQTADTNAWKLRSSTDILGLKIADIAMGSAAFLVAAARYLGDRLVEAWTTEGDPRAGGRTTAGPTSAGRTPTGTARGTGTTGAIDTAMGTGPRSGTGPTTLAGHGDSGEWLGRDAEEDDAVIEARRAIIEHCLYGADINEMAVEMAKLSLWLVSMDTRRTFTFLDDKLVAGDSLLGITSLDQLEYMHFDPVKGREIHTDIFDWTSDLRAQVWDVAAARQSITETDGSTLRGLEEKQLLLDDARRRTATLTRFADSLIGATLAHAGKGERGQKIASEQAAKLAADTTEGRRDADDARREITRWLATDHVPGSFDRRPIHWPLVFPEVFEQGGFDAVVGNPPFLGGQKLTGSLGIAYREHLVENIGAGARGSADLIAYFTLRAHGLLSPNGQTGLIATNTLAQGDTREVGLDQVVAQGNIIRRSVKSAPWPSKSATVEYSAVWTTTQLGQDVVRIADGVAVPGIAPSLDPESRVTGNPYRLAGSSGVAFIGSYVLGLGFTMEPEQAQALIAKDPRNAEVLFPYLNGQDLNSRPDCSARRWVINFHDWPEDRARQYPDCYDQVRRLVKPERDQNNRKVRRDYWWHYAEKQPAMIEAIRGLDRVVVMAQVSKTVMPAMVSTRQVFDQKLVVFASGDEAFLVVLSSAPHYWWAQTRSATMKADLSYSPSDVFYAFALPETSPEMLNLGRDFDSFRSAFMESRSIGLTKACNMVFDTACRDSDVISLRDFQRRIDEMVIRAYGWDDIVEKGLDHGFHPAGKYMRYTIGPWAQREVLDRLLELNHARYTEEVAAGLHDKGAKKKGARSRPAASESAGEALFEL
ncbi:Eco57I restriction-modification methylase domain-containing protein [Parafrankia sp. FMc2]|uniref:Eco57I restriction-modification methylase domain-containing protein n=1 Tax=Parafrankia sp. FMc2 TaxID=3233196 RepID=UPI0034D63488